MQDSRLETLPQNLFYIEITTLIDISTTGTIGRYVGSAPKNNLYGILLNEEPIWKKSRNQQRNWETFIQIIGLRAQPLYLDNSKLLTNQDISKFNFGQVFNGTQNTHNVWTLLFGVEQPDVYDLNNIKIKSLYDDFNNVPITTNLNETAQLISPVVITSGANSNTFFTVLN
jgi:hypothetical protein